MKVNTLILSAILSTNLFGAEFGNLAGAKAKSVPSSENELVYYEVQKDVLFNSVEGHSKGFPSNSIRAYDPVDKRYYQKAVVGKTYKNSGLNGLITSYTHWRYVTVYNVETSSERIAYLPYFQEECHDNSVFMGQWGESRSMKVTLKTEVGGSVSYAGLGLSASVGMSIEQGVTFSTQRRIRAVEGLQARHYPYKLSDTWQGVTYIQTYNANNKTYGYLGKSYYNDWFGGYPYEFYLDNQNIGLEVKREVLNVCEGYDPATDPGKDADLLNSGF